MEPVRISVCVTTQVALELRHVAPHVSAQVALQSRFKVAKGTSKRFFSGVDANVTTHVILALEGFVTQMAVLVSEWTTCRTSTQFLSEMSRVNVLSAEMNVLPTEHEQYFSGNCLWWPTCRKCLPEIIRSTSGD